MKIFKREKKKKILIDLTILGNPYCGLGQIALNYGKYYQQNYSENSNYKLYFLVPKEFNKFFGDKINYINTSWMNRHFQFLLPKVDVWHAMHQLSRFQPFFIKTKYILTIHDINFMYENSCEKIIAQQKRRLQRKINRANEIVCISQFTKTEIEKYMQTKNKKIVIIYNGVEDLTGIKGQKPEFMSNKEGKFFFTIGQIREKKNFHVLIPIMKNFPEYKLIIAGQKNSDYATEIENLIKTQKINNVFLVGAASENEKVWLYQNCEAFLFPSLFEGFGLPVIEAMQFKKPVFSSKETSLKEIGSNYVYFFYNFDINSMTNLIESKLIEFKNYDTQKIDEIYTYAMSYSYNKHIDNYLKLYLE